MRDIYLIDFENVASEGLSGITNLSEEDQVIIFYSNNSNRISMKMHIQIGKSVCKLDYFEILVGGKNALDHQLSTWLGYLIGTGAAERNYYIVSRDMGYRHVTNFWAGSALAPSIRCIDSIKVAGKLERKLQREAAGQQEEQKEEPEAVPAAETETVPEEVPVEVTAEVPVETAQEPASEPEETTAEPAEEPAVAAASESQEPISEELKGEPENQEERIRSFHNRNRTKKTTTRTRQRSGASQNGEARQEKPEKKPETKQGLEQLSAMLLPYPNLQENHLRQLIHDNKKQILCNTLRKQLGQEKGLALYNDIKKIAWR